MTAPQSTPELSREQIEHVRTYGWCLHKDGEVGPYKARGKPVLNLWNTGDRLRHELCDLALRTLRAEAGLQQFKLGINIQQEIEKRFWEKVEKTDSCWVWTACKGRRGYGQIHFLGKHQQARIQVSLGRHIARKAIRITNKTPTSPRKVGVSVARVGRMRREELRSQLTAITAELSRKQEVLKELVQVIDICTPAIGDMFLFAQAHGVKFRGPTFDKELAAARAEIEEGK